MTDEQRLDYRIDQAAGMVGRRCHDKLTGFRGTAIGYTVWSWSEVTVCIAEDYAGRGRANQEWFALDRLEVDQDRPGPTTR